VLLLSLGTADARAALLSQSRSCALAWTSDRDTSYTIMLVTEPKRNCASLFIVACCNTGWD